VEVTVASANGRRRNVRVRRETVEVPSIEDVRMVDRQTGIGYFKLTSFQKTTATELDAALWKLHRAGMRALIIDLRGNPGGLLSASVEAADRFLDRGPIVSTRGRSPGEDYLYTARKPGTWSLPMAVLIDGDSASASEIFAGAIRDYSRGSIVGVTSYGKGSVQGIFPLSLAGAGVRLTTAKFYSPKNRPFSRVGVEPDVVIHTAARPDAAGQAPTERNDAALAAGLRVLRREIARNTPAPRKAG
jgi:carboxyl-terminal processing protease